MKETSLFTSPETLREALVEAAFEGNWDAVDTIAPLAGKMDGSRLVEALYEDTWNLNDDIRDGVVTAWFYIETERAEARRKHFERALGAMTDDPHECVATWAAMAVCKYVDDQVFGREARRALEGFKRRIKLMDRREEGTDWKEAWDFVVEKVKERTPQIESFI